MDTEHHNPDQSIHILIVEDDPMQAQVLQIGLTVAGFAVDVVTTGLAAVEVVQDRNYDAVLVDYNIPEMDGLATARLLGDFLGPIARPILIALTATPDPLTARDRGVGSAFDLILDKTCDLASIIGAITRCLATAPDNAAKRAAKELIYDQAEEEYFTGRRDPGVDGDEPGPVRILVVEDDESQRVLLSNALISRGYSVETATNGLAAVRRMRENCCDLAVVDYDLPELDGVAVASLVHDQMAQAWRPRLIALTATPEVLYGRAAATGPVFDQIIDKAAGLDELIGSVDYLLRCSPDPQTRRAAAHVLPVNSRPASFPM